MTLQRSRQQLLVNVGFASAVSVLVKLRGLILLPIITRSAGAADYGTWAQITALIALIPPVFGLNLHTAVVRFGLNASAAQARQLFQQVAVPVAAASIGFAVVATAALTWLPGPLQPSASLLIACVWLAPSVVVCKLAIAHERGRGRVKRASALEALLRLCVVAAAATCFSLGKGVRGAVFATIGVFGLFAIGLSARHFAGNAKWSSLVPRKASAHFQRPPLTLGAPLRYALPTIPAAVADWSLFAADRYALGLLVDNTAVGIYSACYSVALLMRLLGAPIAYALLPAVGKLWDQKRKTEALCLTRESALYTFLFCLLAAALLIRNGPFVLARLATPQIAEGSKTLLGWLALGIVFWTVTRVLLQLLVAEKRSADMARLLVASAGLNLVCNALLIPVLAANGAALATLISYATAFALAVWALRKTLSIPWLSLETLRIAAAVTVLGVASWAVPESHSWLGLALEGVAFSAGFGLVLMVAGCLPGLGELRLRLLPKR